MPLSRVRPAFVAAAALTLVSLALTGCQSGVSAASSEETVSATDDGTTITMWTRSSTGDFSQALVDAYNSSHKNKVELTVIPFDAYQQKVAAAAGSQQLPDIVASDVVYTPNYVSKGLFRDITKEVETLPFADKLASGPMAVGVKDGKQHGIPHDLDLSAMFYNKVLFEKAGLDPETPPTTLQGWMDAAAKINGIEEGVSGFYFGGNCGGCMLFTTWPSIWADGGNVLNEDGTESKLNASTAADVYALYRKAWEDKLVPSSAQTETGATFGTPFGTGKIGMQILGATSYGSYKQDGNLQIGVAPVPGLKGGESTFVGGDTLSIAANSRHAAQAWDFMSWTLSEEAQIEVIAKGGNLPSRTDLAENKYSAADPNVATMSKLVAKGETPVSVNFGSTFNDANGPWTAYFRNQIFGDPGKQESDSSAITAALQTK